MMPSSLPRPLSGRVLGLSVSESEDSDSRGYPQAQVNRVVLQVVAAFFGQGAAVAFGHDWRGDGVMEAVHGLAQHLQPDASGPLLRNILPWPDQPKLSQSDQEGIVATLHIEQAGLPPSLIGWQAIRHGDQYRYLRARALTHLRHRMASTCDARLCIGGRRFDYEGRYPGVVEEAWLTALSGRPLYLTGILGGATSQVIDAIRGRPMPAGFGRSQSLPIAGLYSDPPFHEGPPSPFTPEAGLDRDIDPEAVWNDLRDYGPRLATTNGLSDAENQELFDSPVLERVLDLVLTGLSRLPYPR